ncbi:putative phytol kinase 2, chloroplastic [Ananas comosus]|uniref:Putative phytol kinase 2, chloroplastic n=1 Tax=Ananas comosus TaxID=4615 RepID=A0A199W2R0_ANACO|nr:putative phytol kinase 2, chloroplastic [Ananas comosus]
MLSQLLSYSPPLPPPIASSSSFSHFHGPSSSAAAAAVSGGVRRGDLVGARRRRRPDPPKCSLSLDGAVVRDVGAAALATGVALGILRFWEELAKRGVFEQKLSRKLVHISIGMAFLLFWPIFSSESYAPFLAALAPGINTIRMLLLGLGIWKNEAMVKSISREGDYRELLKGPLYYACTITLATLIFWRSSPIAIAAICNLCAGDVNEYEFRCDVGKYGFLVMGYR